ncbi:MAG TPA: SIS domain-containing protein [Hyphomicrobium sp.]
MLKGVVETTPADPISSYFNELGRALTAVRVSDAEGLPVDMQKGFEWVAETARNAHNSGNKVILIGNGGSAAIASHHAIEFLKNGGIRAQALNDLAALTCLSNDLGYANVFSEQLKTQGVPGDMLIAISSSGQSVNILKAVEVARTNRMQIATFSGFQPDNLLRGRGDVNFYVNSNQYGFVEVAHHALIQAILDIYVFPRRPAQ